MKEGCSYSSFSWKTCPPNFTPIFALYLPDLWQAERPSEVNRLIDKQIELFRGNRLCLEGARLLGLVNHEEKLRILKEAGLVYLTLVHNFNNDYCDSATDKPYHNGLTKAGISLVKLCEKLEIFVDVSHASDATIKEVATLAERPVLATHSGCRWVTDHPRNLTDDLILDIAETGGLIGIPMARRFVKDGDGFGRHIAHVEKVAGVDHVAIGSDLDGALMIQDLNKRSWLDVVGHNVYGRTKQEAVLWRNAERVLGI